MIKGFSYSRKVRRFQSRRMRASHLSTRMKLPRVLLRTFIGNAMPISPISLFDFAEH